MCNILHIFDIDLWSSDLRVKTEMFSNAVKEREGLKCGLVLCCNSSDCAVVDGTSPGCS